MCSRQPVRDLLIGETTAERIKLELGAARLIEGRPVPTATIKGRDTVRGVRREISISQIEIVEALTEPVAQIVEAVRSALENTAPEIAADIIDGGIVMTGGGSASQDRRQSAQLRGAGRWARA